MYKRQVIKKVADETLGKKRKICRRKGLQIWEEEVVAAIREKKEAYHRFLQLKMEDAKQIYQEKRNFAKTIVHLSLIHI